MNSYHNAVCKTGVYEMTNNKAQYNSFTNRVQHIKHQQEPLTTQGTSL